MGRASQDHPEWSRVYFTIIAGLSTGVSYLIFNVMSIYLIVLAKKVGARQRESVRWQGVVAVLLTVGVMLVSNFPAGVVIGVQVFGGVVTPNIMRTVYHVQYLNVMANFFVYPLAVRTFKQFLYQKISRTSICLQQNRRLVSGETPRQQNQRNLHINTTENVGIDLDIY